ncbi:MAG: rRNA (guanine527-N7)-methyltransferase [Blastocatellia bacterium]|jgi:16S rRNA (guanine527-N7)-methyltransferase|nr:rRNA (guanine527-N7)-methyltransferase [Blastocatellia bacterium]
MPTPTERFSQALRERAGDFGGRLSNDDVEGLTNYYELVMKWNPRLHLVGPCVGEEFATRHILESLVLLPHLSHEALITDVGSGAGLPIIPCLIVRPDLRATLIESSQKKAVFLKEALKGLANPRAHKVLSTRFEDIPFVEAEFVTCRALDRFQQLLPKLIEWAPAASTLLLFAGPALREKIEALLPEARAELIPDSEQRFLMIAQRDG